MSGKRGRVTRGAGRECSEDSEAGEAGEAGGVGRLVDCSQADDRRIIQLVRERRLLYARNNLPVASYYSQVSRLWQEVANEMGWSVADVRRKWSHIRNSYSRHLRNEMYGARTGRGRIVSKWYLADQLTFLREHMATDSRPPPGHAYIPLYLDTKRKRSTAAPAPVSAAHSSLDQKPFIKGPWFSLGSPAEVEVPSLQSSHDSCSPPSFEPDENSAYFQFFRGIYNDYLELPAQRQRQFRRECLTLLHRMLDAEEAAERAINLSHHHDPLGPLSSHELHDSNDSHGADELDAEEDRDSKLCVIEQVLSNVTPSSQPPLPPAPARPRL